MLNCGLRSDARSKLTKTLEGTGWGLAFVWMGIVVLFDIDLGAALLGLGIITLTGQWARRGFGLPLEGFWLVVGTLFVTAGAWGLLEVKASLPAVLLILAGLALLVSNVGTASYRPRLK